MKEKELFAQLRGCATGDGDILALVRFVFVNDDSARDKENVSGNCSSDLAKFALLAVKTLQFILSSLPKLKGSDKFRFLEAAEHTVEECVRMRPNLKLKTKFTVELLYQKLISLLIAESKFELSLFHIKALLLLFSPGAKRVDSSIRKLTRLPKQNEDKTVAGIYVFCLYNACRCLVEIDSIPEAVSIGSDELWSWIQKLEPSRAKQYAKCSLSLFYSRAPAELAKVSASMEMFKSRKLGLLLSFTVCGFALCSKQDLVAKTLKAGLSLQKEATSGSVTSWDIGVIVDLYVEVWGALGFRDIKGQSSPRLVVLDEREMSSELLTSCEFITWFEHFISLTYQMRPVLGVELMKSLVETGKSWTVNIDAVETCARLYLLQVNPKIGLKGLPKLLAVLQRLESTSEKLAPKLRRVCKAFERLSSGSGVAALCRVPAFQQNILSIVGSIVKISEMANVKLVKAVLVFVQSLPATVDSTRLKLETVALNEASCTSEQLQLVSTVCYNNGAKLFNASKFAEAHAHFEVACRAMVYAFRKVTSGHTWEAFVQIMKPERWQTLGLSYEKISNPCVHDALVAWSILCFLKVKEQPARFFTKLKVKAMESKEDMDKSILQVFSEWWENEMMSIPMQLSADLVVRVVLLECRAYKRSLSVETFRHVTQAAIAATDDFCTKLGENGDLAVLVKIDVCVLAWTRYARVRDGEVDTSEYYRDLLSSHVYGSNLVLDCLVNAWYSMVVEPGVEALEDVHQTLWHMKEDLQSIPALHFEALRRCCFSVVNFAKLHGHPTLLSHFLRLLATLDEGSRLPYITAANCFMKIGGDDSLAAMIRMSWKPQEMCIAFAELLLGLEETDALEVIEETLLSDDEDAVAPNMDGFKRCWLRSLLYSLQFRHNLALLEAERAFRIVTKAPLQDGSVSRFEYWQMVLTAFEQLGYLWERRGDPRSSKYYYEQGCALAERIHAKQRVQVFKIQLAKIGATFGKPASEVSSALPQNTIDNAWIVQSEAQILQNMLLKSRHEGRTYATVGPQAPEAQTQEVRWWIERYKHASELEDDTLSERRSCQQRHEDFLLCLYVEALSKEEQPGNDTASVYSDVLQTAESYSRCRALYAVCLGKLQASDSIPSSVPPILRECVELSRRLCEPRSILSSHRLLASIEGAAELSHFSFAPALNLERSRKLEKERLDTYAELDDDLSAVLETASSEYKKHTKQNCSELKLCLWSLYSPVVPYTTAKQVLRICLDRYLPSTWTTCSISTSEDQTKLYLTRERHGHEPIFIERYVGSALVEWLEGFQQLVEDCEATTKGITADVAQTYTKEQKVEWWERRGRLDLEFQHRLLEFQTDCLGPCRLLLYPSPATDLSVDDAVASCKALLEARQKLTQRTNELLVLILESLDQTTPSELSSVVEELLDLQDDPELCNELVGEISQLFPEAKHQDQGSSAEETPPKEPCDMLVKELRAELSQRGLNTRGLKKVLIQRLEEAREQESTETEDELDKPESVRRNSMIVILCEKLLPVPIESIPICSSLSITRMPSISFVLEHALRNRFVPRESDGRLPGTYVVDPRGDLPSTRKTFEPIARRLRKRYGWSGVIAEKPSRDLWEQALKQSKVLLYCGHGAAEEIYSRERVAELAKCAVTFLMGCSSGKLLDQGAYEPAGVVWSYLLAGCPSLLCSLWDVTDQDIDRFTVKLVHSAVFDQAKETLGSLIKDARAECKLRYLVGAAPVCYGVPLTLAE